MTRIVRAIAVALGVLVVVPAAAAAQFGAMALGSVSVTPDGTTTPTHYTNTSGHVQSFIVKNNYTSTQTFELTCFGRVNITCTDLDLTEVTLGPGASTDVTATYSVGSFNIKPGRLVVLATGAAQDTGYYNIPSENPPPPTAPVVALRHHNGENRDRGLCLTSGAGEAAAWQCGDLLVTHGLPGYATMGRDRSLTLLYSSAQAVPKPLVVAAVTQNGLTPSSVFVRLSINGVATDSAWYSGWESGTRQIAIAHDATNDSTGLYPFSLLVRNIYPDSVLDATINDTLIVVNRAASRYGAGWSLAGVEELRLNQSGSKILWVGGDGSAKVYRSVGTNTWQAAAGAYRDTLIQFDSASVTWWRRTLRHGVKVTYRVSGSANQAKHVRTTNRVGLSSFFTWSGDTLTSIAVPPTVGSTTTYTLVYAAGKLDRITDPAGRILDVTVASNRLTQILDPDGATYSTAFGYDGVGRMVSRTNRRGFTNRFGYANGLRVTSDSIRTDTASVAYSITTFAPWDERGLAVSASGNTAVDTALAYTKIDGPRAPSVGDTAEFWVNRWGAPTKIRDPLGNLTTITRGDAAMPALVTRVLSADGRIMGSGYDSRGNVSWTADSTYEGTGTTQTVTTSYVYGDSRYPDSPTQVRSPVDTLTVSYDSLGLPSVYTAQGGHQTQFAYFPAGARRGLLSSVKEKTVPVVDTSAWTESSFDLTTSFNYDSLGNQVWMQSPKGLVTSYTRDVYTRVTEARDAGRHLTRYAYDLLNRMDTVVVYDDTLLNGPKATKYRYNASGLVDRGVDPRGVQRLWYYDAAERAIRETDDVGNSGYSYFNAAGLADSTKTRSGHVIRHTYDAAGRLTQTIYPANGGIPGDTIVRTYDVMGRALSTMNRNAVDSMWYNREGTLRMHRLALRNDSKTVQALDTLKYWYDAGGRRSKFLNGVDTVRYTYGLDGLLAKLKVDWMEGGLAADSFLFTWDALGRRDRVQYTNGTDVTFGYDRDGHLRLVCSKHPGGQSGSTDYLEQRLRYSALDADGQVVAMQRYQGMSESTACSGTGGAAAELYTSATYDARHQVLSHSGSQSASFTYDASGNVTAKTIGSIASSYTHTGSSNRLASATINGVSFNYTYDADGRRTMDATPGSALNTRKFFYNALGQMVGDSAYWDTGTGFQWHGAVDMFRYDAAGRRTEVHVLPGFYLGHDGPNVVRAYGGTKTWRFIHGPGVDDPLIGVYWANSTWTDKYYYLTDGRGRQLAFTRPDGANEQNQLVYTQNGGAHAGGITASNGFDNERSGAKEAPRLSFYRNRYYDQETGRWTQEDPIGIAGGVNLYQFNGNNPAVYTDPFGLCKPWPDCMFQSMANWGAQTGGAIGTIALNIGAGLNAASEAVGTNDLGEAIGDGDVGGAAVAVAGMLPVGKIGRGARLLESTGSVVIGETMTRVRAAAASLGAEVFETTARTPRAIWKENSRWLRTAMRQGKRVIDIGFDATRSERSKFYQAEKALIKNRSYPTTRVP